MLPPERIYKTEQSGITFKVVAADLHLLEAEVVALKTEVECSEEVVVGTLEP